MTRRIELSHQRFESDARLKFEHLALAGLGHDLVSFRSHRFRRTRQWFPDGCAILRMETRGRTPIASHRLQRFMQRTQEQSGVRAQTEHAKSLFSAGQK